MFLFNSYTGFNELSKTNLDLFLRFNNTFLIWKLARFLGPEIVFSHHISNGRGNGNTMIIENLWMHQNDLAVNLYFRSIYNQIIAMMQVCVAAYDDSDAAEDKHTYI